MPAMNRVVGARLSVPPWIPAQGSTANTGIHNASIGAKRKRSLTFEVVQSPDHEKMNDF
jgi:hypothetical protein